MLSEQNSSLQDRIRVKQISFDMFFSHLSIVVIGIRKEMYNQWYFHQFSTEIGISNRGYNNEYYQTRTLIVIIVID
jgi:hypothetical protein